jgi:hypothetical protein
MWSRSPSYFRARFACVSGSFGASDIRRAWSRQDNNPRNIRRQATSPVMTKASSAICVDRRGGASTFRRLRRHRAVARCSCSPILVPMRLCQLLADADWRTRAWLLSKSATTDVRRDNCMTDKAAQATSPAIASTANISANERFCRLSSATRNDPATPPNRPMPSIHATPVARPAVG